MKRLTRHGLWAAAAIIFSSHAALAGEDRQNRSNDPFMQISRAVADCPVPLGPMLTEQEWAAEAHHRTERGNSCWVEGRCRLSNAYQYDPEIAESVQRRLTTINYPTHWRDETTLWLLLQRRFIYVQGCVSASFDKKRFLSELAKTADVDKVIDQTTANPSAAKLPYTTLAHPEISPASED